MIYTVELTPEATDALVVAVLTERKEQLKKDLLIFLLTRLLKQGRVQTYFHGGLQMSNRNKDKQLFPYVVVGPEGLAYTGLHYDEQDCLRIFLGWPTIGEVRELVSRGYYVAQATLTWRKP